VYYSAAHPIKGITLADCCEISLKSAKEVPFNSILWKSEMHIIKYKTWYYMNVIFLHLIPGLLVDGLLRLSGKKPLYVNIYFNIYVHIYI